MKEKLEAIKSALRRAIELSEAMNPERWRTLKKNPRRIVTNGNPHKIIAGCYHAMSKGSGLRTKQSAGSPTCGEAVTNAAFIAHARTFTPAAAKALLTAIERGESCINDKWGDDVCDNDGRGCRACEIVREMLETICREWPEDNA